MHVNTFHQLFNLFISCIDLAACSAAAYVIKLTIIQEMLKLPLALKSTEYYFKAVKSLVLQVTVVLLDAINQVLLLCTALFQTIPFSWIIISIRTHKLMSDIPAWDIISLLMFKVV